MNQITELEQIEAFAAAEKLVKKLRIEVNGENHLAWTILYRVTVRLKDVQIALGNAYFAELS
jgi:hypothetical protein